MRDSLFYEMYIEPFTEGFWGCMIALFVWIISLFIAALILVGTLYLIDSVGLEEKKGNGVIVSKHFTPAHTYYTTVIVNKTPIMQSHFVADSWQVTVKINGMTDSISIDKYFWESLHEKDNVKCIYTEGRIQKTIYIKGIDI